VARASGQHWSGRFRPVRDPLTGELLDWNAAERLRQSMLGDDPTSALPAWFWCALRFAASHPRMTLEPEEILSEAWIAAAEMLRRRYGSAWPEAAKMFLTLRESPVGCQDLLALENRAASRSVRNHLEHDLLEQDLGWRKCRRRLQRHLASRELPPDELVEREQTMDRLEGRLPGRFLNVLEQRGEGFRPSEIARRLGMDPQRAHRLEVKALAKARAVLRAPDWAPDRDRARARRLQKATAEPTS
jgi:hypothetical protein